MFFTSTCTKEEEKWNDLVIIMSTWSLTNKHWLNHVKFLYQSASIPFFLPTKTFWQSRKVYLSLLKESLDLQHATSITRKPSKYKQIYDVLCVNWKSKRNHKYVKIWVKRTGEVSNIACSIQWMTRVRELYTISGKHNYLVYC